MPQRTLSQAWAWDQCASENNRPVWAPTPLISLSSVRIPDSGAVFRVVTLRWVLSSLAAATLQAWPLAFAQTAPQSTVRDSSGVRVVEHRTLKSAQPAFNVGTVPLAAVGGLRNLPAEEIEGSAIEAAVRLSDGRLAILENWTVRILMPDGRFDRVIGGEGGGPGQFSARVTGVCRIRGDTIILTSTTGRQISVFDSRGRHVRTVKTDGPMINNCADDGTFIMRAPLSREAVAALSPEAAATQPVRAVLRRLRPNGRVGDSIGVFEGNIGAGVFNAIVPDRFTVAVHGGTMYADNGSKAELKAYSLTGALTAILRWHDPLTPLSDKLIADINDAGTPLDAPPGAREASLARVTRVKQRPFLPAYTSFFIDAAGRLWLRDYWPPVRNYRPAGETRGYVVFAPDGALLGRFDIPGRHDRASVTDAGADYVVVRTQSQDEGVKVVVLNIAARSQTGTSQVW